MKKVIYVLLVWLLIANGCQQPSTTRQKMQTHVFNNATWLPNEKIHFSFAFHDTSSYVLQGNIIVKKFIPFTSLPLTVVIQTPEGSTLYREVMVSLRSETVLKGEEYTSELQKIPITLMPYFKPSSVGLYAVYIHHGLPTGIFGYVDRMEVWFEKVNLAKE